MRIKEMKVSFTYYLENEDDLQFLHLVAKSNKELKCLLERKDSKGVNDLVKKSKMLYWKQLNQSNSKPTRKVRHERKYMKLCKPIENEINPIEQVPLSIQQPLTIGIDEEEHQHSFEEEIHVSRMEIEEEYNDQYIEEEQFFDYQNEELHTFQEEVENEIIETDLRSEKDSETVSFISSLIKRYNMKCNESIYIMNENETNDFFMKRNTSTIKKIFQSKVVIIPYCLSKFQWNLLLYIQSSRIYYFQISKNLSVSFLNTFKTILKQYSSFDHNKKVVLMKAPKIKKKEEIRKAFSYILVNVYRKLQENEFKFNKQLMKEMLKFNIQEIQGV